MLVIYLVDPGLTELSYTFFAPWMHAGWAHLWKNLLVFLLLGAWTESRVGWLNFLPFAVLTPYLALYIPVAFGYGGLSRGASGLTMALTGYAVPALLTTLTVRFDDLDIEWLEVGIVVLHFLALLYLTADAFVTVKRFLGLAPRPAGVAVSAHFTGFVIGVLWFAWRAWRQGLFDA